MTLSYRTIIHTHTKTFPTDEFLFSMLVDEQHSHKMETNTEKTAQLNFQIKRTHAHFELFRKSLCPFSFVRTNFFDALIVAVVSVCICVCLFRVFILKWISF